MPKNNSREKVLFLWLCWIRDYIPVNLSITEIKTHVLPHRVSYKRDPYHIDKPLKRVFKPLVHGYHLKVILKPSEFCPSSYLPIKSRHGVKTLSECKNCLFLF